MTKKETKALITKIKKKIKEKPKDVDAYEDLFSVCRTAEETDFDLAHKVNRELRGMATDAMRLKGADYNALFCIYKRSLLFDAPHFLDCYLLYLELNRAPEKRFYQPRRKVLKQVVDALQDLTDDKLDELFLSMPPRVGKTSLVLFYVSWLIGRNPENPNLYSSYTDVITRAFYNGVLEIITDKDTYLWSDVFPNVEIARKNAADETIDMGRAKHYPTLTCRSIDGTLNGACDAQDGVIIADDLVSGIEEALSKDRLVSKWSKVDNNLIPRGKGKTKYLWIGTRWSVIDPAGVRIDTLENDEKYKGYRWRVINLPALDENDESNFEYPYGVGFDTLYYQRRRASFERNNDMASWLAQFMGQPIEREGALFEPDGMRYYNGVLPDGEPDRVFMPIDPAFGGGDFVSGPVFVQYGEDLYLPDVVFDNSDKRITIPLVVQAAERNGINAIQVEANKSLESYKDEIDAALREAGLRINLTGKPAPTNKGKAERIFDKAPEIREHVIFLESGRRNKAYSLFMQNVFSYKILGKNKNDDAPDSLAMGMDMFHPENRRLQTGKNPFKRR
jgi:predicted phage terminase large subunit-like protein